MDGLQVVLGEKVEGAKHLVILNVKRPGGFKLSSKVLLHCSFYRGLLLEL
jgi:hypothetical protein